jgi:hypothetical protein
MAWLSKKDWEPGAFRRVKLGPIRFELSTLGTWTWTLKVCNKAVLEKYDGLAVCGINLPAVYPKWTKQCIVNKDGWAHQIWTLKFKLFGFYIQYREASKLPPSVCTLKDGTTFPKWSWHTAEPPHPKAKWAVYKLTDGCA